MDRYGRGGSLTRRWPPPATTCAATTLIRGRHLSQGAESVQVPSWQPVDLRERSVDALRVEAAAAFEEGLSVAEVADVGAAARNHDGVGTRYKCLLTRSQRIRGSPSSVRVVDRYTFCGAPR